MSECCHFGFCEHTLDSKPQLFVADRHGRVISEPTDSPARGSGGASSSSAREPWWKERERINTRISR